MKTRYFSTGYIYVYSIALVILDAFTISRNNENFFDFELLSMRVVVLFSFWLIIKNLAGIAERRGYSYKLALVLALIGLPLISALISLAILKFLD